ncbi:MAG: WD40 repeat domain-containing protein [archaeon]|nr:WD40 repeat domain-containing protein [archaeon]
MATNLRRGTMRKVTKRTTRLEGIGTEERTEKDSKKPDDNPDAFITKTLSFVNPSVGSSSVYYSYIENKFMNVPDEPTYLNIFSMEEGLLAKDDLLNINQEEYHDGKKKYKKIMRDKGEAIHETPENSELSLRNKLTYCTRASETPAKTIVTREVETKKLDRVDHDGIFHAWDLFDSYMAGFIKKKAEDKRLDDIKMRGFAPERKKVEQFADSINRPSLIKALKLLERQIMQIINQPLYHSYRNWSGPAGQTDSSTTIVRLLSFPQNARIKNRNVTALCWNTKFEDLFAAGFGNYEFPKSKEEKGELDDKGDDNNETGFIYVFSIKNNYFPEVKYKTESGVLCLDFHPKDYTLLVAGLYDGTVCVYDISKKSKFPFLTSDIRTQKHMDPVWTIKWYSFENEPGEYVFYSISSDGKVKRWSFFKNKSQFETEEVIVLKYTDALQEESKPHMIGEDEASNTNPENANLTMEGTTKDKQDEALAFGNAGGMCFDFNPHKGYEHFFVVGTEEGRIYLCSTKHREHSILNYEGHTMGCYSVAWNPFHPKVFGSCSADWTIKIWHYKAYAPLIVYDMQSAIGDLAWSPWCSTIFATVNASGEIKFFDLNRARKTPLDPKKFNDTPINRIAFNKSEFVLITGNNSGKVTLWKMAETIRVTIDKQAEEEKRKEKEAKQKSAKAGPTTKIVVPANLQENLVKVRKAGIQKKQIKVINMEDEKKRVDEFLELLDITDL